MKLGLPILAKFVHYSVVGVPPEIMGNLIFLLSKGIGPALAIPDLLSKTGVKKE